MLHGFIKESRGFYYALMRLRRRVRTGCEIRFHLQTKHPEWRKLGDGYYGQVWAHRDYPGLVLKISGPAAWGHGSQSSVDSAREFYGQVRHDAWPVFARHCAAHKHDHLPEILHLESVSPHMTWAIMPEYKSADYHEDVDKFRWRVIDALRGEATCPEWLWPIKQMAGGLYYVVDIHAGNVMVGPKGLVLTDPFSTTGDSNE